MPVASGSHTWTFGAEVTEMRRDGRLTCTCDAFWKYRGARAHECDHTTWVAFAVSAIGGPSAEPSPTFRDGGWLYLVFALRALAPHVSPSPMCAWCPGFDPSQNKGASHRMCPVCQHRLTK